MLDSDKKLQFLLIIMPSDSVMEISFFGLLECNISTEFILRIETLLIQYFNR